MRCNGSLGTATKSVAYPPKRWRAGSRTKKKKINDKQNTRQMRKLIQKHILTTLLLTSSIYGIIHDTTIVNNSPTKTHITIASEPDYPPYCLVNEEGEADGFAIDLFKAAADAVGLTYDIKIGVWNKIKQDLAEGRIDALPLVGRTPEREELFDFTLPYLSLHGAVFAHEDTEEIHSLEDLKTKSIVVMKGDNAEEFVRRENISENIFTTNTFEEAFQLLENGDYDAIITQRILGIKLIENLNLESVEPLDLLIPQFRQDFCFAVKKGDDKLLKQLNEGLSVIIANDIYEDIRLKWFGPSIKEKLSIKDILVIAVYVFIPLFLIMALVSIFILKREVKRRTKTVHDEIAEHKNTLNKLRSQQELFKESEIQIRLLLDSTAEGIIGIDENAVCTFCNNSAAHLLKFSAPDQLVGKNLHNIVHPEKNIPEEHQPGECKIILAVNSGKEIHVESEIWLRADKTTFYSEYYTYPLTERKENLAAVVTFWDVTESERITRELNQTKEYLENLITYANAPIIVWNKKLKIERFNRAFERLTGLKFNDVVNRKIDILFPEEKRNNYMQLIEATIEGERWETVEIEIQNMDGSIKNVLWNSANIYDDEKNLIATIAQGSDITGRKLAEQELIRMKEELESKVQRRTAELNEKVEKLDKSQMAMLYMVEDLNGVTEELKEERRKLELSNKELEAFSYSVSHDLRAPLRAIDGFSKFIVEDYSDKFDDEGKRLLKVIRENANKMDRLIADMLNLSRLSRSEINLTSVEMRALAEAMYLEIATQEEKELFEIDIKELPNIEADSTLMKQVWQNLIGNALKYSHKSEQKKIEIGSEELDNKIVYWIKDYGAGFNEKYISKIFGVFQRLHSEKEFEGTGVGLAIVQRILHRHGGEIWAKGEVNQGATFYFSLPK